MSGGDRRISSINTMMCFWIVFSGCGFHGWKGCDVSTVQSTLQTPPQKKPAFLELEVFHVGVEPKKVGKPPKWMVYFMENPSKIWMMWEVFPLFLETPMWQMLMITNHWVAQNISNLKRVQSPNEGATYNETFQHLQRAPQLSPKGWWIDTL